MTVIRLIGGLTPGDASDPRTFPEIFNAAADVIDASEAGLVSQGSRLLTAESDIDALEAKNPPAFSAVAPTDGQVPVFDAAEGVFVPGEGGAVSDATTSVAGVVLGTTSDGFNTALGLNAFVSNTTGANNTSVGRNALRLNDTSVGNTAVGAFSLEKAETGGNNTAVGLSSLTNNVGGVDNVTVGHNSARDTTSNANTAVGKNALVFNTTGDSNVAIGMDALRNNAGGIQNVGVGRRAGDITTTGSNNATLGHDADPSSATASNQITLGNTAITALRCNVTTISSLSDVRDKTDIVDTQHGLDTLNKIRPVDFTWARRDGTFGNAPDIGFIAQELASVEDETGDAHRLRLTLRDNPEKLEATPGRLIPILVKAVQELSAKNDELEARLVKLEGK